PAPAGSAQPGHEVLLAGIRPEHLDVGRVQSSAPEASGHGLRGLRAIADGVVRVALDELFVEGTGELAVGGRWRDVVGPARRRGKREDGDKWKETTPAARGGGRECVREP